MLEVTTFDFYSPIFFFHLKHAINIYEFFFLKIISRLTSRKSQNINMETFWERKVIQTIRVYYNFHETHYQFTVLLYCPIQTFKFNWSSITRIGDFYVTYMSKSNQTLFYVCKNVKNWKPFKVFRSHFRWVLLFVKYSLPWCDMISCTWCYKIPFKWTFYLFIYDARLIILAHYFKIQLKACT